MRTIHGINAPKPRSRLLFEKNQKIRAFPDRLTARHKRMRVCQVFYACEMAGIVPETERGYADVQKQLAIMRRKGLLSWDFIADGTRGQRKPSSWDRARGYVESMSRGYRRNLWQSQDTRIELWLGKDALADPISPVTRRWDVPPMVSRGLSRLTFLHTAGEAAAAAWERHGAETFLYAEYDNDAGGEWAFPAIERDLPEFADDALEFSDRLARTDEQVAASKLATRPAKKNHTEAATWDGKSCVELDALSPDRLTSLVDDAIVRRVDLDAGRSRKRSSAASGSSLRSLWGCSIDRSSTNKSRPHRRAISSGLSVAEFPVTNRAFPREPVPRDRCPFPSGQAQSHGSGRSIMGQLLTAKQGVKTTGLVTVHIMKRHGRNISTPVLVIIAVSRVSCNSHWRAWIGEVARWRNWRPSKK